MKAWLRLWLIERLGGYPDVESALDSVTDTRQKYQLLTLAVKKHFNTIGAEDILRVQEDGSWILEGRTMSEGQQKLLIAEAVQFLGTKLWKVLQADIKYQANRKMFLRAENEMQLTAGKLWLYILDAIKTRLVSLEKGKGSFNSKE